ncbi:phosphatase PAP2 family protein [Oxalobacteraceae bacterium R-40]|uniref:Phosphatase PAP2 family protein n=1 Tax=Keguizhuia sedimenti TaxID=3064264 RepID=A0ABU1BNC7_9BURK|nr:phosphatase PAP2 family protein [Oxalobacteraceae bacterium R-40]
MTNRLFFLGLFGSLLAAVMIGYISVFTDLDLFLSDLMFDAALRDFPAKDTWFASVFMHRWVKYFFIALGLVLTALLLTELARTQKRLTADQRRKLLVVVLAFFTVPLLISLLKSQSMHHCPWDLERYGGFAPYLRLFDDLPKGIKAGHCFPAGHASSALWVAALAVFWLPRRPLAALTVFALGLAPGLILGWVQQMRGAHFLTHTLWSAWIAGFVILVLSRLLLAPRA